MPEPREVRRSAYAEAGVDYAALDAGKREALSQALATTPLLGGRGGRALDASRGEPAFVFELGGRAFAFVLECLGTKSIIAREMEAELGPSTYAGVAYDTVAAVVNDLSCVGALPLVVNAYFATGSSDWYADSGRHDALVAGWRDACVAAGAVWGGGESPSLRGLVSSPDIELAGAAVGAVPEGRRPLLGEELRPGDEIVLVQSSGLHANGASLARTVAQRLPDGYRTKLPSGRRFGEAVLEPSLIYSRLVERLLADGIELHYLTHITGHGFLKLMRPRRELTYRVHALPEVPEVLEFLVAQSDMGPAAAYRTFNMGAGFALYCAPGAGAAAVEVAQSCGLGAQLAGEVEAGPRRVVLEGPEVVLESQELELGPPT